MTYTEIKPSHLLSHYVWKYWFLEGVSDSPGTNSERILPDGCTELIIHYGQPFRKINANDQQVQDNAFVFGQLDRFIDLLPDKNIGVMGVRFFPWGLSQFLNIPVSHFKGEAVGLGDLFSKSCRSLIEQIIQSNDAKEKAQIMDDFLIGKFKNDTNNLSLIVRTIREHNGSLSINQLARITGKGERQLERLFYSDIGLSPKEFSRITRFQLSLNIAGKAKSLTDLALSAGYYDQSHFTREFTEISGNSPRNYFKKEKGLMSVLYNFD